MADPLRVQHFSDVLCVWAYIGQLRLDELRRDFGEQVEIEVHFCDVFGSARSKLEAAWKDRGGLAGYSAHVRGIVEGFGELEVHPEIWTAVTPTSSMSCHLFLRAIGLLADDPEDDVPCDAMAVAARAMRLAFFRDAADVSKREVQQAIAEELGLPLGRIDERIASGEAFATLAGDLRQARGYDVRVSPTVVLDDGRQHLNGNVGYRVIEANVRQLLRAPDPGCSWC